MYTPNLFLHSDMTFVDAVRNRRKSGEREAAAVRKQRSAVQKTSHKVATAGNDASCRGSGPDAGNMIACDSPDCPIEWFHFEYVALVDALSGKWLCTECAV